jgi:hypothetical protein
MSNARLIAWPFTRLFDQKKKGTWRKANFIKAFAIEFP